MRSHRRMWRPMALALSVSLMALPFVTSNDEAAATGGGGPVLLDGGDPGYHGWVTDGALALGWDYLARWYRILLDAVPGTYTHNGRVAVIGATADAAGTSSDCGSAVGEVGRVVGVPIDSYRGNQIADLMTKIASGEMRYQMLHIVEQTDLPNSGQQCSNGLTQAEAAIVNSYAGSISAHVNRGGALFANNHDYSWLSRVEPAMEVDICGGFSDHVTAHGLAEFPEVANPLVHQVPYHGCLDASAVGSMAEIFGYRSVLLIPEVIHPVAIGGLRVTLPVVPLPAVPSPPPSPSPEAGPSPALGGGLAPPEGVGCLPQCGIRLWGEDRFGTAAVLARDNWGTQGAQAAVIALGTNFPDAIVGGPLAAQLGVPTLLVKGQSAPTDTLDALRDLDVEKVYLVGGPAAVGEAVANQLRGAGLVVERLFGSNRYATSAQVASNWNSLPSRRLYVADGRSFTDQIVAASLASADRSPLLLWEAGGHSSSLIAAEAHRLRASEIVAVGAGASSAPLEEELPATTRFTRITADSPAALSVAALEVLRQQPTGLMLVTERDFADALAATPIAAGRSMHLVLTPVTCAMPEVSHLFNQAWVEHVIVVGGPNAVASTVLEKTGVCS